MDINKLKTLLAVDHPISGAWKTDDALAAAQANAKDVEQNKTQMTGQEVAKQIDESEYIALPDAKKSQFLALIAAESIDPFGLSATVIKDIFGAESKSVTALAAARLELVSVATSNALGKVLTKHVRWARE